MADNTSSSSILFIEHVESELAVGVGRGRGRGKKSAGRPGARERDVGKGKCAGVARSRSRGGSGSRGRGRGRGRGQGVRVGRRENEARVRGLVAEKSSRVKEIVQTMEAEKLRELILKLVEREPGLVFDLCELDGPPQPPPPPPPGQATGSPVWCCCGNCTGMPTYLMDKCCGCQPQNCVSQREKKSV